jgi:hypothetical protein
MDKRLLTKLRRMYPSCTRKELEQLAASMEGDKYWRAGKDFVFAVALTRARRVHRGRRICKVTGLRFAVVSDDLHPYCRRARILLLSTSTNPPTALLVTGWPTFIWATRKGVTEELVEGALAGALNGYVNVPALKVYLKLE